MPLAFTAPLFGALAAVVLGGEPMTGRTLLGMALTVGGMLIGCLRHLPADGESVVVSGFRFRVESVTDRGVQTVLIEPA